MTSRISGWSSTMKMRSSCPSNASAAVMPPPRAYLRAGHAAARIVLAGRSCFRLGRHRQEDPHPRSLAGSGVELEPAAEEADALPEMREAVAAAGILCVQHRRIEAYPLVTHFDAPAPVLLGDSYLRLRDAGVLHDVEEQLAHDLEYHDPLILLADLVRLLGAQGYLQAVQVPHLLDEPDECFREAFPLEHRRAQVHGQPPHLFDGLVEPTFDVLERLQRVDRAPVPGRPVADGLELVPGAVQPLLKVVVQYLSHAGALLLLRDRQPGGEGADLLLRPLPGRDVDEHREIVG